jgi:hypothetical protein
MLKCPIREGALYSDDYQASGADDAFANMKEYLLSINPDQRSAAWFRQLLYSHMHRLLKEDQYFSSINGLRRIMVAENTYALGEKFPDPSIIQTKEDKNG